MIWQKLEIIYLQRIDYTKKYEKKISFMWKLLYIFQMLKDLYVISILYLIGDLEKIKWISYIHSKVEAFTNMIAPSHYVLHEFVHPITDNKYLPIALQYQIHADYFRIEIMIRINAQFLGFPLSQLLEQLIIYADITWKQPNRPFIRISDDNAAILEGFSLIV